MKNAMHTTLVDIWDHIVQTWCCYLPQLEYGGSTGNNWILMTKLVVDRCNDNRQAKTKMGW